MDMLFLQKLYKEYSGVASAKEFEKQRKEDILLRISAMVSFITIFLVTLILLN